MNGKSRTGICLAGMVLLLGASTVPQTVLAQEREAPQGRPVKIRWTAVKRVNNQDRSFVIQRAAGRDGERAVTVDTLVVTGKATQFVIPPREGQPAPPPGAFANIVVGARVSIMGTLSPDGKVLATQVMVSPSKGGPEGRPPVERNDP
jgi:hypothetical protein